MTGKEKYDLLTTHIIMSLLLLLWMWSLITPCDMFQMKYNEIEPEEFTDFTRKLEDGELLSGLTQNLNLADYGIPEVCHPLRVICL